MLQLNVDCLVLIFKELPDKTSLHSCLLVNREWCHLVIPILWKEYSWCNMSVSMFNMILSLLPSSSRQLLSDNGIKLPSSILLKPPLFNYISFCKFPISIIIDKIIKMVLGKLHNNHKRNLLEQEIYKLFSSQCVNIKELHWETSQPLSLFPGASTCFSKIYSLSIDINFVNSNSLHGMAQICKNLNELVIYNYSQDISGLISLIDVQRNLKTVKICYNYRKGNHKELGVALARKGNTINDLYLDSVSTVPPSVLTSFINLRKISINNFREYEGIREDISEFQQYLAISEFPDLKSLDVVGLSCFKELAMLIEKTKGNVSNVDIYTTNKTAKNTGMLIKAIVNHCPKIKCLYTYLELKDFIHIKSLLLNCRYLELIDFDSLNYSMNENDNVGDELLDILTEFSPKSLTDITISGDWKCSLDAFERFFESCRGRHLSRFEIIYHYQWYITKDHRAMITKYINEGVIKESNCRNY